MLKGRFLIALISSLFVAAQFAHAQTYLHDPLDNTLTACSFNMQNDEGTWNQRREHIKTFMIFHMPDIVCAQEITKERLADFDSLPQYRRAEYGSGWGGKSGLFNAVFFDINRLKLEKSGVFWFSKTPKEFSTSWGAKVAQSCTWTKFTDRMTNKVFFVFNLQWFETSNEMKVQSARLLPKMIREIAGETPFILCGDFGAPPTAGHMGGIMSNPLFADAKKLSKITAYGPEPTEHDVKGIIKPKIHKRLNYIFASRGVGVLKYGTMTDGGLDDYPSYRYPVIIQFDIK